jgi:hypothetical protein
MKLIKLLVIFLGLVWLFPGEAPAATVSIQDTTLVQPWYHHGTAIKAGFPSWGWRDIVATNPSQWDIKQVDVSWSSGGNLLLQIYTNYPQNQAGLAGAGQADIALDFNRDGIFETGIVMRGASADIGKIYNVTSWKTTETLWQGNWLYAGRYASQDDLSNSKAPLTVINRVNGLLGRAQVTVDPLAPGSLSLYRVNVELPQGFNEAGQWDDFDFLVYSGSCGNETVAGSAINPIPLPPTLVLLGSGLLALGWRARKSTGRPPG